MGNICTLPVASLYWLRVYGSPRSKKAAMNETVLVDQISASVEKHPTVQSMEITVNCQNAERGYRLNTPLLEQSSDETDCYSGLAAMNCAPRATIARENGQVGRPRHCAGIGSNKIISEMRGRTRRTR
jgi:hypothetical protein